MGLAFDPMDTKRDPDVYFTAQKIFHKGKFSTSGMGINGRIMKASGPSLETLETVISGLPVSDYDHGLNAIEFGDMGELYFTSGSNTNGGIPGQLSSSQLLKENFLSGGVNVAYLSHPDFNGNIQWSAPDDGNMIAQGIDVFGMGLRNSYGIVLHSNGQLYATDNGPNTGYGKMSTGCGPNDFMADQERPDKILRVQKGSYYGHPNRKRASYFNQPHQCVWRSPEALSNITTKHTVPLLIVSSSRNGLMEFHGNHFGGQLRGNLIMTQYRATPSLTRVILHADGDRLVVNRSLPLNIGSSGLDITQAPNGNLIEMQYSVDSLAVIRPVLADIGVMVVTTVFPRRGPNAGGYPVSIFGMNFGSTMDATSLIVTIGKVRCMDVILVSSIRIDCLRIPGGFGTVDITITNSTGASSTFEQGYRYISGLLPNDFILPVYR
jgi:glucose/arabinose dehydrogenase